MRFHVVCATSKASDQPSLCKSLEYSMTVKPLTEHHLEFLNLTLKAPITTAADDKFCYIFPNFWKNKVWYFMRIVCQQIWICCLLQIIGGALWVKMRLHRLVRVFTCQNTTMFEITCCGSIMLVNLMSTMSKIFALFWKQCSSRSCWGQLTRVHTVLSTWWSGGHRI